MNPFALMPGERLLRPDDPCIQYTGRVDDSRPDAPVLEFPATSLRLRVTGPTLRLLLTNVRQYWENRLGVVVDGTLSAVLLTDGDQAVDLSPFLHEGVNDVLVFKRQDSCHDVILRGLAVQEDAQVLPPPPRPGRRMEVYGDSVSAGEVSEADDYAGKADPEHCGQYSNVWWSYAWLTARALRAELHDIAQGGIALEDGTGYFNAPAYTGMLSCYDKVLYNPAMHPVKAWDFRRYRPHVVVVAIGQNDAHPVNFMEEDYHGARARQWRASYRSLVERLRAQYPRATIILATTILNHSAAWDRAIDEVCAALRRTDARVHHFLYASNGCGTPGHIRRAEAERMAEELSGFIRSLGEDVWAD